MATRMKLTVAYLGDPFLGWQRQPRGRTVQGELEGALAAMTGSELPVVGAGRTDAGVHAAGQVAHVDLPAPIPPDNLRAALNRRLPPQIRVRTARVVPASFHARRDAHAKHYAYRMRWTAPALPWLGLRSAVAAPLARAEAVAAAAAMLEGCHDVASFTVPEAALLPTRRQLFRVWLRWRPSGLEVHFIGDGFLRYQVRRMVGALGEVGAGRIELERFRSLLLEPCPGAPLPTAPARGLTLERVFYRAPPRRAHR